ncbi:MAG: DUF2017 family protein [Acidimicrobiales bacterium]
MSRRRIRPAKRGAGCDLKLPAEERRLLETLPTELSSVIAALDSSAPVPEALRRLFPRAYVSDEEAQQAYAAATHVELAESHRVALETLASTAHETSLTSEQMGEWMSALNDLRLVLGTVLGVSDHDEWLPPGPAESEVVIYHYLTMLQSELIEAMEQSLPEPVPGADDQAPEDPWGEPLGGLRWDGTPEPPDWSLPPRPPGP